MTTQKRALVTGATAGLGYEFAVGLANRGYHVVIASRNQDKMQCVKRHLNETYGVEVTVITVDLSKPNGAEDLFAQCKQLNIHILINNAAYGAYGHHVEQPADGIAEMIQLDVTAVAQLSALFGRIMKSDGSGYIMNVGSIGAYGPVPMMSMYGACKSFVLNFTEALSKELEDHGVSVTCFNPGPTKTDFYKHAGMDVSGHGPFNERDFDIAAWVAEQGLNAMFAKKLSPMVKPKHYLMMFPIRILPRSVVANIHKRLMEV